MDNRIEPEVLAPSSNDAAAGHFTREVLGANDLGYVFLGESRGKQRVDTFLAVHVVNGEEGSGYGFHALDSGSGEGGGGAIGGATGRTSYADGVVGNRRDSGPGNGVAGTRLETGDGNGVQGVFASSGNGSGVSAVKRVNYDGVGGIGPALSAQNESADGQAIYSLTSEANSDPISHVFERRNARAPGVNADFRMLGDGEVTEGTVLNTRVLIQPGEGLTGPAHIVGQEIGIGANVKTTGQVTGLQILDLSAAEMGNHYGATITVAGVNATNIAMLLTAINAINNIALKTVGAVVMEELPVVRNGDDEAVLLPNSIYCTPDGALKIRLPTPHA